MIDLELHADPFDVYRALRLLNPSPYLYFLRFPEVTVVGASPEPMVRLREGIVTSRPIAGSRPRGENEHHDRLLEGELAEDPKELAEHIMLVDLARNDVGRVVSFGTEVVDPVRISKAVRELFDLRPAAIVRDLDLLRPIYRRTAAYGHFGRSDKEFTWEATPKVDDVKQALDL